MARKTLTGTLNSISKPGKKSATVSGGATKGTTKIASARPTKRK